MLILNRKKDEVIVINGDIKIKIVDIRSDGVKIGVEAPSNVKIYRKELWENIQAENIVAAKQSNIHTSSEIALQVGAKIQKDSSNKAS